MRVPERVWVCPVLWTDDYTDAAVRLKKKDHDCTFCRAPVGPHESEYAKCPSPVMFERKAK